MATHGKANRKANVYLRARALDVLSLKEGEKLSTRLDECLVRYSRLVTACLPKPDLTDEEWKLIGRSLEQDDESLDDLLKMGDSIRWLEDSESSEVDTKKLAKRMASLSSAQWIAVLEASRHRGCSRRLAKQRAT